jgi:hypothetical protein
LEQNRRATLALRQPADNCVSVIAEYEHVIRKGRRVFVKRDAALTAANPCMLS